MGLGDEMAATVGTSLKAKYAGNYLASPDVDEDALREQRRLIERDRSNKATFETKTWFGVNHGQPIPEELLPRRMRLTESNWLSDFNGLNKSALVVSQRFKEAHDRIHVNCSNQFVPVEILNKDGSPYDGQFYFFNITTVRDAINPVLGGLRLDGDQISMAKNECTYTIISGGYDKIAVYKDRIAGLAAWVDLRLGPNRLFFSDAFLGELAQRKLDGFGVNHIWQEL
jgi:hypothetical protein